MVEMLEIHLHSTSDAGKEDVKGANADNFPPARRYEDY